MKKEYYLVACPNWPSAKIEPSKIKLVECSRKDSDRVSDDYERELNGGETYNEAFSKISSADQHKVFSSKSWWRVMPMTFAQARDYSGFESWPCNQ